MQGTRMTGIRGPYHWPEGAYGLWEGMWYCKTPGNHAGNLMKHDVVEHSDGTITVSPSILVTTTRPDGNGNMVEVELWHGYLERGVWRSV